MPVVSAGNLTKLRTTRHATLLRLCVYTPASIWTARVNGLQATGDTTIVVASVVQVKAPFANARVLIGSSAGASDYGEARFRSYSAPTLTVAAHNATLPDTAYVTIVEEIKPAAKHPTIDDNDVVTEDGNIAYTDENTKYQPIARMGAPAVAFIDPATGLATVNFYSRASAYGGAALVTHAWVFPSGTPGTSALAGSAGAPIAVTWNAVGQYYVSYTVTDNNGKTHTTYRPVFILNQNSGTGYYTQIEASSIEGDVESGIWQTSLTVWTSAPKTAFPENALCVLFAEDWYGDAAGSIGNELYRENIVMVGYIRRGTVKKNPFTGSVEFVVESVSGVMDNLWCLAGGLETTSLDTTPGWHVLSGMTYELAVHHVLTQHSTITQIADCTLGVQSYTAEYVDLTDASLLENLRQAVAAVRGRLGCTAQGGLVVQDNPQLVALAGRSTDYVLTLTMADVRDEIDFGDEEQEKEVSQVDFCGDDANADPVFSLAPATPWSSGHSERIDGIRVANQSEANTFAGLYEGYRNNSFADVVINWRGNYRVFDIYPCEPLAVTIAANQNARGIAWTSQRCWIKRVSMEYRAGILLVTTNVEKDASGSLGVTGEYPIDEPVVVVPPPTTEPPIIVPPAPAIDLPGKGNLLYICSYKGVAKCTGAYGTNGTDGAPVWTAVNSGLVTADDKYMYGINFDPFSRSGDHFTRMWGMSKTGLWLCDGLPDAGAWTQKLTVTAAAAALGYAAGDCTLLRAFAPSVHTAGLIVCFVGVSSTAAEVTPPRYPHICCVYSTDNGATWSADKTKFARSASANPTNFNVIASGHQEAFYLLCAGFDNQIRSPAAAPTPLIMQITAPPTITLAFGNASYTTDSTVAGFPYCNTAGSVYPDDKVCYAHFELMPADAAFVQKWTSMFSPLWSSGYVPPASVANVAALDMDTVGMHGYLFNMLNESYQYVISVGAKLWVSSDTAATWTGHTFPIVVGGRNAVPASVYPVPVDGNLVFLSGPVSGAGVAMPIFTTDLGATWHDISLYGTGGALDTVLGLALGDMAGSIILVDYFKP